MNEVLVPAQADSPGSGKVRNEPELNDSGTMTRIGSDQEREHEQVERPEAVMPERARPVQCGTAGAAIAQPSFMRSMPTSRA